MFQVLTLNKIAACGLKNFNDNYAVSDSCENPDAVVLRSYSMHDMPLPSSLKAIARAGAGVNNIPIDKCSEKGIVVFNTPGANANAVKELVVAGLMLASRKIVDGIEWAKTLKDEGDQVGKLVEKGKSQFAGQEVRGKKLVVVGLGAIGVMVANVAHSLDMDVVGYDPFISVNSALHLSRSIQIAADLKEALADADYVSIHIPLNDSTKKQFNAELIGAMKDGVRILNFSRDTLVDDDAMADALESGKVSVYVTDFPNSNVLTMKNVIAIPHLGASTEESEDNCAVMAVKQVADYLENGNITNSVNFPACSLPRTENDVRLTIAHKNIPNMVSSFSSLFSETGTNIENMINKSKKEYAYTMMDIAGEVTDEIVAKIQAIDGVLAVRVIK